jgi:hypothetical protein
VTGILLGTVKLTACAQCRRRRKTWPFHYVNNTRPVRLCGECLRSVLSPQAISDLRKTAKSLRLSIPFLDEVTSTETYEQLTLPQPEGENYGDKPTDY